MDDKKYLEYVNTMVVSLDTKGNVIYLNKKAEEILGQKRDKLIGKSWVKTCLPKQMQKEVISVFKKIISNNEMIIEHFENSIVTTKGKERKIQWFNSIIRDSKGKILEIISSRNDVTEKRKTEEVLKNITRDLIRAQNIAGLGRWYYDLINDKLSWSDEIFEIFKINKKKIKVSYNALMKIIHPEDRVRVQKTYKASLTNKIPYDIMHRIIRPNGEVRWVKEMCDTVYEKGKPISSSGIIQDITIIKKSEEVLKKQNQELEQFKKMSVNRELKMIQLKHTIAKLKKKSI